MGSSRSIEELPWGKGVPIVLLVNHRLGKSSSLIGATLGWAPILIMTLIVPNALRGQEGGSPAGPASLSAAEIGEFLAQTESPLQPASPDRVRLLALELESRGLTRAARELRGMLKLADLARELLRLGQSAAALEVIHLWQKEAPGDPESIFMEGLALASQGMGELALRALERFDPARAPKLATTVRTLRDLTLYRQTHGQPASIDGNPWQVRFSSASEPWRVGGLPTGEKEKLPPTLARDLADLLRYEPLQGWLWGLLGEVLNAEGQSTGAQACLLRARSLGYTPRWVVDHLRLLGEAQNKRASSIPTVPNTPTGSSPDPQEVPGGWESLTLRPRELTVVIVGAVFALFVIGLQIRQWRSGK
jgi:hypothetical protein